MITRRVFILSSITFVGCTTLRLKKEKITMCTEVKHGPNPQWKANILPDSRYSCTIEGYYTDTNSLTAAGVNSFKFNSNRSTKQIPELLGLRTAFIDFFINKYKELGGTEEEALEEITGLIDARKKGLKCHLTTDSGQDFIQGGKY